MELEAYFGQVANEAKKLTGVLSKSTGSGNAFRKTTLLKPMLYPDTATAVKANTDPAFREQCQAMEDFMKKLSD